MALFRLSGQVVIELYLLYIKLIIQHIVIISGAQRNLTIFVLYKCSPYTSNNNVKNYHSFWSYDNNFLSPKHDLFFHTWGGGGVPALQESDNVNLHIKYENFGQKLNLVKKHNHQTSPKRSYIW